MPDPMAESAAMADSARVHPETRADWRRWLEEHHTTSAGVWLVSWKSRTGKQRFSYEEAVEEALCFGWIDSKGARLDEERTMLWFTPRKRGSAWARSNKQRIERLEREGRLAPAGRRAVETAKQDGSWTRLDDVEELIVPDDLAAAFADRRTARQHWDAFPPSARRSILAWIAQAKRDETRQRRIEVTAEAAARGERANESRPRS